MRDARLILDGVVFVVAAPLAGTPVSVAVDGQPIPLEVAGLGPCEGGHRYRALATAGWPAAAREAVLSVGGARMALDLPADGLVGAIGPVQGRTAQGWIMRVRQGAASHRDATVTCDGVAVPISFAPRADIDAIAPPGTGAAFMVDLPEQVLDGAPHAVVLGAAGRVLHSTEFRAAKPAITFMPTRLLIAGASPVRLHALRLDGVEVPGTLAPSPSGQEIALPDGAADARPHRIDLELLLHQELLRFEATVRAQYAGAITCTEGEISGWILDTADPDRPVALEVEIDGAVVQRLVTGLDSAAAREAGHAARRPGFRGWLPASASFLRARSVTPRVAGTGFAPFGTFLSDLSDASYTTLDDATPGPAAALLRDRILRPAITRAARSTDDAALRLPTGFHRIAPPHHRRATPPVVDVVIPVYRGFAETIACLESVLRSQGAIAINVIVIDDHSPDAALSEKLAGMAQAQAFALIRNAANLGFVRSANLGLSANPDRDVILLNADTIVPPGWVDRLHRAAHAEADIATATALSNNATICSLPAMGGQRALPYGLPLDAIDALCAAVNDSTIIDLPTAHGFCMFIRRDALDDVGLFDAETFGRGYGEENDFSQRAAARGWRNVAACDVFVAHHGSVSFADEAEALTAANLPTLRARYPDYHRQVAQFMREDPLHMARNRIQMALWRGVPSVVLVTLAIGGGVARHVADAAAAIQASGSLALVLQRAPEGRGYRLQAAGTAAHLAYPDTPDARVQMASDLLALRPDHLHVHHLIDLDREVTALIQALGIPYQVTLHDYFHICPRVTLLDEGARFCGVPDAAKCTLCIRGGGAHPALDPSLVPLAEDVGRWRDSWGDFLAGAARVIAPSQDTAARHARILPDLPIAILPHETIDPPPAPEETRVLPRPLPDQVRVAVIGAIGPHKGVDRLIDLIRHAGRWAEDLSFVIVGFTSRDAPFAAMPNVEVTGAYEAGDLPEQLAALDADVALFLSPWPETYSYTLSEALAAGLTPVAYEIGAIGERMRDLGCGVLRPLDCPPEQMVDAIREAAGQKVQPMRFLAAPPPSLPAAAPPAPVTLLRAPGTCDADGWAGRVSEWVFHLDAPVERATIEIWLPDHFAGQFVTLHAHGQRTVRLSLAPGRVATATIARDLPAGIAQLRCGFDFDVQLSGIDLRRKSGIIRAVTLHGAFGTLAWVPGQKGLSPA
jgi:GT2 family glycosyltransferase/glycosyltransferase involved in cell wall biosynthesis